MPSFAAWATIALKFTNELPLASQVLRYVASRPAGATLLLRLARSRMPDYSRPTLQHTADLNVCAYGWQSRLSQPPKSILKQKIVSSFCRVPKEISAIYR